jgi:hypothetical protein
MRSETKRKDNMKNKKWFWYPSFLSKQGLLFYAKKEINFPGSKYSFPKKDFIQVNLFKINISFKSKLTGKIIDYGTKMKSWYLSNDEMDDEGYVGSIYYRSPANCWKMFNKMFTKTNFIKKNKFKQLRLI